MTANNKGCGITLSAKNGNSISFCYDNPKKTLSIDMNSFFSGIIDNKTQKKIDEFLA